jgi:hypothetical protein
MVLDISANGHGFRLQIRAKPEPGSDGKGECS